MAVGGGFLTPFLIGGDTDAQAALFGYDAILVAGTAALSGRREWPGLNLVSYWLTLVTIAGWFSRFYTDAAHVRTVLCLTVFCALWLHPRALAVNTNSRSSSGWCWPRRRRLLTSVVLPSRTGSRCSSFVATPRDS
jgi:uncharacterized membrane protein